jgi:cytochrome c peroxidase
MPDSMHTSLAATILAAACVLSCGGTGPSRDLEAGRAEKTAQESVGLTAQDRLTACAQDPRVVARLVSPEVCAGAGIFFTETFNGNGRTCASCHPVAHNFTIDAPFIATIPSTDPLFVFEQNPNLSTLETSNLRRNGGVLENVDGFEDLANKFVVRGVPHVLSMATSLAPDVGDGTTNPPVQRTGWGGDGAPGTGSLREFLTGAVIQHYPKTLARQAGVDFRLPTSQELDLVAAFQLNLGRTNELDLTQVRMFDSAADTGRQVYMDPLHARCNVCHFNGGANSQDSGFNRNFDTGNRLLAAFQSGFFDAGFGGRGLAQPNFDTFDRGVLDSFGNGTFNTPPLIEAADTPPFFHTNAFGNTIEAGISFYNTAAFQNSPAATVLTARFGGPLIVTNDDIGTIGRFLRTLNAAFNLDISKQRLRALQTLINTLHDQRLDIQRGLLQLAQVEINDAQTDLNGAVQPFYPVAQDRLGLATSEISAAIAATNFADRNAHLSNAVSRVENARDQFGSNINYTLGQANLMF